MKKSLLNIITLVLVLMNTALTGIMVFAVVPSMQDSNRVIKKVAQAINLELDSDQSLDLSDVPLQDCVTFDLSKLTILLKKGTDGKEHYAVIYPTLSLYKNAANYSKQYATLEANTALATQHIQEVVQKYTVNELQSNPDAIRKECLGDLQEIFGKDFVVKIAFGTTTIQ